MKVLIIGTWQKHKAASCSVETKEIGKILAQRGFILISGGGDGIAGAVAGSYKANGGKKYICYIPSRIAMEKVGENIGLEPDELIETDLDYPERNLRMVRECDVIIAIHGGLGTLTEIINAIKDYNKKVVVIDFGEFALWIKSISQLSEKVFLIPSPINLF